MVKKEKDKSKGLKITITTQFENEQLTIDMQDDGNGIFKKLSEYFKLTDTRESVLHLTKGKITTDPTNHTGEGIFFTSRALDFFEITANNFHYYRNNQEKDWALETISDNTNGTCIRLRIHQNSNSQIIELFKQFQDAETLAFNRT